MEKAPLGARKRGAGADGRGVRERRGPGPGVKFWLPVMPAGYRKPDSRPRSRGASGFRWPASISQNGTAPTPGRYPLRLSDRWTRVVLVPVPDVVVLGFFLDGEPTHVADEPRARRS